MTAQSITVTVQLEGKGLACFELSYAGRLYPVRGLPLASADDWREAVGLLTPLGLKAPHFDAIAQISDDGIVIRNVYPWSDLWTEIAMKAHEAAGKPSQDGYVIGREFEGAGWHYMTQEGSWAITPAQAEVFPVLGTAKWVAANRKIKGLAVFQKDGSPVTSEFIVMHQVQFSQGTITYWNGSSGWEFERSKALRFPSAAAAKDSLKIIYNNPEFHPSIKIVPA